MDVYHVVCHECPEEAILVHEDAAQDLVADHCADTGHDMSLGTISQPSA